jgi:predicted methyltransferase
MRTALLALFLIAAPAAIAAAQAPSPEIAKAVAAPTRTEANIARDRYRHPAETLAFLGVKPSDHVVEIWPFGGWWTEILVPYLEGGGGRLSVVLPPGRYGEATTKKLASDPATYGKVTVVGNFPSQFGGAQVAPGSADVVLTFRNIHNWRMGWNAPEQADYSEAAFREIYAMLKPGGILGIEDHRLPEDKATELERSSGYIKTSTVRALAEKAGFRFAGASEVNANPKDTQDHPNGVWSLPPTFAGGDTDRARFAEIGESDRMTLKFVKPE